MSLALGVDNWWECFGDELWAMNLWRKNFVAQRDECHYRGRNQSLSGLIMVDNGRRIYISAFLET